MTRRLAGPEAPGPAPRARRPAVPHGVLPDAALDVRPTGVWVATLVRVGPGGEVALRARGAEVGVRVGDIVTARVPLDAVPLLLGEPSIRRMEAAVALTGGAAGHAGGVTKAAPDLAAMVNDSAMADARFDALRRRVGDRWEGLAGQGVIVGIYDSGLDLRHEDFLRPDGSTRVLYAWDQTSADTAAPGVVGGSVFTYGFECAAPVIDAGSCPMRDVFGHGTHVAGVAAGDGSATGKGRPPYRFPGGAPEADLIVVKGGDFVFDAGRLIEGVAYIFARAEALGRPAVVNISLSSNQGPHDGTTLHEQALDAMVGPGRIIVSGAGNAGDHRNTLPPVINGPNHAQGAAGTGTHALIIPPYDANPGSGNDAVALELWYDGADSLTITIRSPRGDVVSVATGDSALVETPGGAIGVLNAVDGPDPENGDHVIQIVVADYGSSPPPDSGRWALEVSPQARHGDGVYHLWLSLHSLAWRAEPPRLEGGTTNRYLVGIPASADRVLAAGAHVTKHAWSGVGGEPQVYRGGREDLGDIAFFSSPGPRRDGVQKPDVTAPGKVLISALSRDAAFFAGFPWLIEEDSVHVGLLGTSMAAPQLAAAVAILLQIQPDLTPEQARDLIRLSAARDVFVPAALPHPVWGTGKLDAAAAARRLRPEGLAGAEQDVNLSANPVRGDALVINYAEVPRSLAVYTIIGERVRGFGTGEIGPLSAVWALDTDAGAPVANGAYVLVAEFPGRRVLRKILVARP
ncbi:MAG TPA: S8 family serine peptidase [Longimicrobiales bacterium]|nr:S8 family serine peptidase [Longimicrobiales bacterium]